MSLCMACFLATRAAFAGYGVGGCGGEGSKHQHRTAWDFVGPHSDSHLGSLWKRLSGHWLGSVSRTYLSAPEEQ
eukprot:5675851-Amphidinium_carterae.2